MKRYRRSDFAKYTSVPAACAQQERYQAEWTAGSPLLKVFDKRHIEELWYGGCFGRGCFSRSQPIFLVQRAKGDRILAAAQTGGERNAAATSTSGEMQPRKIGLVDATSDEEHLILCPMETVYLSCQLKCLDICTASSPLLDSKEVNESLLIAEPLQFWRINCLIAMLENPPAASISQLVHQSLSAAADSSWLHSRLRLPEETSIAIVKKLLCNRFIVNYVAYHHYRFQRKLVVRRGIKYGCDFVLYERGPVMQHAGQAVLIMEGDDLCEFRGDSEAAMAAKFNWFDVSTHVRVLGNVKKQFRICYVSLSAKTLNSGGGNASDEGVKDYWFNLVRDIYNDPMACLAHYSITEIELGRWIPERTRD